MRFGERIRPSGLTGAQKVLQHRWYSVDKPLGLPCGVYATTKGANVWVEPKKKPGTEKVLVGTRLLANPISERNAELSLLREK